MLTKDLKSLMQEVKEESRVKKEAEKMRAKRQKYGIHQYDKISQKDSKKDDNKENEEEEEEGLNREEFAMLLTKVGLGNDQMLIDKIFWIFDEDGSGDIDHKELGVGLELLKNTTFEQKLDKFFDLCDEDNSGTIDKKEFYTMLRLNVTDYEDRNKLKTYVNEIYQQFDKRGAGELTKEEMIRACQSNQKIKNLIEKNVKILKDIDNWIASDFAKPFTTKISFCAGLSINNRNNAVYYPSIDNFIDAFETKEQIYKDVKTLVNKYQGQLKYVENEQHLMSRLQTMINTSPKNNQQNNLYEKKLSMIPILRHTRNNQIKIQDRSFSTLSTINENKTRKFSAID